MKLSALGLAAPLALALAADPAVALAADAANSRFERPLRPAGAGPNRAALDSALLAGARPIRYAGDGAEDPPVGGLEDLRLVDAAGAEVPYLLMLPTAAERRTIRGEILPIPATKVESGFEVDLGAVENVDRLTLDGLPAPFLKRYRLEGSGDRRRWTTLVADGTLFDLPEEGLSLLTGSFAAGPFRYLRWIWNDADSARAPRPRSAAARTLARAEPPAPATIRLEAERRVSEPRVSRFHLRLPGRGLPIAALALEVEPGDLSRVARVTEPRLGPATVEPVELGEAMLRRSSRDGGVAAALEIPIARPQGDALDLVVEDGDNGPLRRIGVSARLRPLPWIYFESRDGAPLVARYGGPETSAPRYDLEASRRAATVTAAAQAIWGEPSPARAAPAIGTELAPLPLGGELPRARFLYERALPATGPGLRRVPLDAAVLAHSRDLGDLRLATAEGRQAPYLLERRAEPLEVPAAIAPWDPQASPAAPEAPAASSRYAVLLPFAGLPSSRLAIATRARVFARDVRVFASGRDAGSGRPEWRLLARLDWRHADPEGDTPELTIELPRLASDRLLLEVDEGDNSPLPISAARLLLPSWQLRFFATGGPLRLLYGDPALASPRYDLELLAPRLVGVEGEDLALPAERALATAERGARSGAWFWIGLVAAVLALLALLARLLLADGPR
ncbi:MAG: DUF3999 family protein [Thermoanaerobaculia bacterium]